MANATKEVDKLLKALVVILGYFFLHRLQRGLARHYFTNFLPYSFEKVFLSLPEPRLLEVEPHPTVQTIQKNTILDCLVLFKQSLLRHSTRATSSFRSFGVFLVTEEGEDLLATSSFS